MYFPDPTTYTALSAIDFSKGFVYMKFFWKLETLVRPHRSREFSIPGRSGIKWTLALQKRQLEATIGLYCKESSVIVPTMFRICIFDGHDNLLMNRSCYFTYAGSNGCGFSIENWAVIERRLRLQNRPLAVYLVLCVPTDRRYLSLHGFLVQPKLPPTVCDLLRTQRAQFQTIECPGGCPMFSDIRLIVSKGNDQDESGVVQDLADKGSGNGKEGSRVEIRCHGHVLCMWSSVFSRMLTKTDFRESNDHVIDLSADTDRATMIEVLRYMYCGEIGQEYEQFNVGLDAVIRLLNAAEKYDISGLKEWCQYCMIAGYDTDEQRRRQLSVVEMYGLNKLKAICVAQLSTDPVPINDTNDSLSKDTMDEIENEWKRKEEAVCIEIK